MLVYAYAVGALWTHHRLAKWRAARTLVGAVAAGIAVPACGCTALPYARRLAPRLRAPFLVAAYAGSLLVVAASWALAGVAAAFSVVALAASAALVSAAILPAPAAASRKLHLEDLLLPRDARVWRDAVPYLLTFGAPVALVGGLVAGASASPAWMRGLATTALAILVAAPVADVAAEQGDAFARGLRAVHVVFALGAGGAVGVLA